MCLLEWIHGTYFITRSFYKHTKCALLWSMCTTCACFRFSTAAALFSLLLYVICWNCSVHQTELLIWKFNSTHEILIFWVWFMFKNYPTFFNSWIWFNCLKCRFTVMVACCYFVIKLMERGNFRLFSDRDTDVCWLHYGQIHLFQCKCQHSFA